MSEEEKKAIEELKWYFRDIKSLDIAVQTRIVLNLIEKQQKEIRKLKKCHLKYEEMTGVDLLLEE